MSAFEKKRLFWARITALSAVGVLVVLGLLAAYVAQTVTEFRGYETQVDVIVDRLDDVSAQLAELKVEEIVTTVNGVSAQLQSVDVRRIVTALNSLSAQLEGIDWEELAGNVNNMAVSTQQSLVHAEESIDLAMESINRLDIDALNKAISDLQEVVEPLAVFAGKFK